MNALWMLALVGYLTYDFTQVAVNITTRPVVVPSRVPAPTEPNRTTPCDIATLGGLLVVDSLGYLCERFSIDGDTGCCSEHRERNLHSCLSCLHFSDQTTVTDYCCEYYEHCVSCCMVDDTLHECSGRCRTASMSLRNDGKYERPTHRYCLVASVNLSVPSPSPSPAPILVHDQDGNPIEWLVL
jgi:hypothetical protein